MTLQQNKDLAVAWFEASFSGDFDLWQSLMSEDFRYWSGGRWHDRAGHLVIARRLSEELIDGEYTMDIGAITAEGDRVVIEAETNYDVPGGGHYRNFYCWVVQIRDGKILSVKGHTDTLHASRIFDNPDVSADGGTRASPLDAVTRTLAGRPPKPTASA